MSDTPRVRFAASAAFLLAASAALVLTAPRAHGSTIGDRGKTDARERCEELCQKKLDDGVDLSKGPCLSDELPGGVVARDTVCDVAHNPRTADDDDPANQCAAYRDGRAGHFVEVNPECDFIREH